MGRGNEARSRIIGRNEGGKQAQTPNRWWKSCGCCSQKVWLLSGWGLLLFISPHPSAFLLLGDVIVVDVVDVGW